MVSDYVYIPLGGNQVSKIRGHINMWITMVISDRLWHGAAWHYIVWGAFACFFFLVLKEF